MGRRVVRKFGRYLEVATVTEHIAASHGVPPLWHVVYEADSDEEDLEEYELIAAAEMYTVTYSRDLDVLPPSFAWQFEGHELCGASVLRTLPCQLLSVGRVVAWIPACVHHEEPAVFVICYENGMSVVSNLVAIELVYR